MTDLRSAAVPPVRDEDHVRGPAGAPVVIMYADFSCPRCALAWERLRGAALRICFRHFALRARHPRAAALSQAAEAAAAQGAFWRFADALYADQGHLDDPHLWARCEQIGLDLERFEADRRSVAASDRVDRDVRDGIRAGVTATPTLLLCAPDGRTVGSDPPHPGPPDPSLVREWTHSDQREMKS